MNELKSTLEIEINQKEKHQYSIPNYAMLGPRRCIFDLYARRQQETQIMAKLDVTQKGEGRELGETNHQSMSAQVTC